VRAGRGFGKLVAGRFNAVVVAAMERIVKVAVPAVVPALATVGVMLQVGRYCAPVGELLRTHAKATGPVNPFTGVTETVSVFAVVAPAAIVNGEPVTVNGGVSVNGTVAPAPA
jgi:hypothetical protein